MEARHGGHSLGQIWPPQNSAAGWEAFCTGKQGRDRRPGESQPFPATREKAHPQTIVAWPSSFLPLPASFLFSVPFLLFVYLYVVRDKVLLYSSGCPGICYVEQAGSECLEVCLALPPHVLRLNMCTTKPVPFFPLKRLSLMCVCVYWGSVLFFHHCRFWGSNSDCQTCSKAPVPAEPSG